jgi:capsular polysaccharide export protein
VSAPCWAVGFSARKRSLLAAFHEGPPLRHAAVLSEVPDGAQVLVWGSTPVPGAERLAGVMRVEDGFLRSVGLGAAFARPVSWVFDDVGIHYDASRPSALEGLLQQADFPAAQRARAAALRRRIVAAGLTKYNVGGVAWQRPPGARRVLLAVGQVESDASLAAGSPRWRSNAQWLRALREEQPDAHLLYKPHPDVIAGLRAPGHAEHEACQYCDAVLPHADIAQLLGQVDECHVLTSLAGFEALLRGVPVVTHGQPFYAGWGLTEDRLPIPRRTRRLSLDELVAGVLLRYPRYASLRDGRRCDAETALEELLAARQDAGLRATLWRGTGRLAGRLVHALRHARGALATARPVGRA